MEIKYVSQSKNEHLALRRTIGFKLFMCRQRKKMTQRAVWKKTGISPCFIDRLEIGKGDVEWGDVLILLKFYGRNIDFNQIVS